MALMLNRYVEGHIKQGLQKASAQSDKPNADMLAVSLPAVGHWLPAWLPGLSAVCQNLAEQLPLRSK